MLIINNFSVHVTSKVNEFWIKNWIKILTIAPYSPNSNSIEKVTLSIKSKTRSYLSEGKRFNLKMLQNLIYNSAVWDLSGFIGKVIKKLFKRWKTLIRIFVKILK